MLKAIHIIVQSVALENKHTDLIDLNKFETQARCV